jgi:hypothetical protein
MLLLRAIPKPRKHEIEIQYSLLKWAVTTIQLHFQSAWYRRNPDLSQGFTVSAELQQVQKR